VRGVEEGVFVYLANPFHMSRNRKPILLWVVVVVSFVFVGCSARKPVAQHGISYRLKAFGDDSLLLPPSIPDNQPSGETIQVKLPGRMVPGSDCSAARGPFRLESDKEIPSSLQIHMPSLDRWLSDLQGKTEPDSSAEVEDLEAFLVDVDRLQSEGCFSGSAIPVRDLILQSLPIRPQEGYYTQYGYRLGQSGMDMKPGIRLKVERAYFRPPASGEDQYGEKTFQGLSVEYFDVERASDGKTAFRRSGAIQYSPADLVGTALQGPRDFDVDRLPPEPRYRLFFYTFMVAEKRRRAAAIIGAREIGSLDAIDQQLRANPRQDCRIASASRGATCFDFHGFVTLSTQISVEVNGKTRFVEWGVRVKDVVPKTPNVRTLKTLRVERRFGEDTYYDVRFDRRNSRILSLVLVGGDRVSWK
jgi:hypothetical protein